MLMTDFIPKIRKAYLILSEKDKYKLLEWFTAEELIVGTKKECLKWAKENEYEVL